jgi:acid phosphatase
MPVSQMPALPTRRDFIAGAGAGIVSLGLRRPAAAASGALPFLVVGDWGRDGASNQREVAEQMGHAAERIGSRFVISVGDNFYSNGIESVGDSQWQTSFEQIYAAPSLMTPWHVILGNHDYRGNVDAQIAYSATSPRWRMPARYYLRTEPLPDGGSADFFFIDTNPFVQKYYGSRTRVDGQHPMAQLAWLDDALGRSQAPWKIVVGHHPVFSGGTEHGSTPELIAALKPLLDRHGVRIYMGGHDHDQQHLMVGDVHYIQSGAGSETRPSSLIEGSRFASDRSGFMTAELAGDRFEFAFIDERGERLYQAVVPRSL